MTKIERQIKYAYLTTSVGVVLAVIATTCTTISSFPFGRTPQSQSPMTPRNFTGAGQFGNFTGAPQFGNMNPYGGFANGFALLAVIIAVVGVLWLGLSLRRSHLESREGDRASARDKPRVE